MRSFTHVLRVTTTIAMLGLVLGAAPGLLDRADGAMGGRGGGSGGRSGGHGGGWHGGHGHGHFHGRHFGGSGVFFYGAGPWWGGAPYWYYPSPYWYSTAPYPYVAPEPVYIERPAYWYYCENPPGYYPYVQHCGTQWLTVIPHVAP